MYTRKFFLTALTMMCVMTTTTVFTACGDDDDNNTPADGNKATAAVMNCDLTVGDDMFNYLDLTVEYYDANGQVQSEQMTAKNWKKTVQAKLPATLGARLKIRSRTAPTPPALKSLLKMSNTPMALFPRMPAAKRCQTERLMPAI